MTKWLSANFPGLHLPIMPFPYYDRLSAAGSGHALTTVLLGTDIVVFASAVFFLLAARGPRVHVAPAAAFAH